jgi:tetratricopeptide (TPR) repeat protein
MQWSTTVGTATMKPALRGSLVFAALLAAALLAIAPIAPAHADDLADVQALVKQGSLTQASERLNVFLAKNPKDARGRFLRGLILTEQKRPNEAIKVFVALTEDYPELPEPYNNLAVLYAAQGQFDRARQMLELAIRTHPSYATAHENLGDIYAKMASEAYDKALQLDRSNTLVQTKLALIRELFSSSPKFQRSPLAADAPKQVAITSQPPASTATAGTASKGAGPTVAAAAAPASRPVVARASELPAAAQPAATAAAATATATASSVPAAPAAALPVAARPAAAAGSDEIIRTVEQWARAWSGNDVNGYLAFYSTDFKVPGNESRADWEKGRRDRIAGPKKIEVRVLAPEVTPIAANRVSVTFRQDYRSPTLKSQTPKTLTLVRVGDRWLIEQEKVGR